MSQFIIILILFHFIGVSCLTAFMGLCY